MEFAKSGIVQHFFSLPKQFSFKNNVAGDLVLFLFLHNLLAVFLCEFILGSWCEKLENNYF